MSVLLVFATTLVPDSGRITSPGSTSVQHQSRGSAAQFAHLQAVAYTSVRGVDSNAVIANGGLSLGGDPSLLNPQFFNQMLADPTYPAAAYIDAVNFHTYGARSALQRCVTPATPRIKPRAGTPSDTLAPKPSYFAFRSTALGS